MGHESNDGCSENQHAVECAIAKVLYLELNKYLDSIPETSERLNVLQIDIHHTIMTPIARVLAELYTDHLSRTMTLAQFMTDLNDLIRRLKPTKQESMQNRRNTNG